MLQRISCMTIHTTGTKFQATAPVRMPLQQTALLINQ